MAIKQILKKLSKFTHASSKAKINRTIKKFIKKNNLIITGSRALNAQTHFPYQRAAKDYDIYARTNAKQVANKLQRALNKARNGNYHYVKTIGMKKKHYMVMDVGADLKKRSRDDFELASVSNIPRQRFKTVKIRDNTFAHLKELEKSKIRTTRFKKYGFRHKKDLADLKIIQTIKKGGSWI